jgi:hypothetical protein
VSTLYRAATEEVTIAVDFDCASCGYAGTADVRARGTGEAQSFLVFDRKHAERNATEQALEDAQHQARVTASLLRCPQCGRRARGALVAYTIGTALGALVVAAIAVVVWWATHAGIWHWVGPGAILLMGAVLIKNRNKRIAASESLLERFRIRPKLPAATALKIGAPHVPRPVVAKAPEPAPPAPEPGDEPKLLG